MYVENTPLCPLSFCVMVPGFQKLIFAFVFGSLPALTSERDSKKGSNPNVVF